MTKTDPERMLKAFIEMDALTRLPRTGWLLAGVSRPESVSDHCFETAIFAYLLSRQLNVVVDMRKVLLMALFHETAEARITDLPRRSKDYIGRAKRDGEAAATLDILDSVSDEIPALLEEMHELVTPEARLVEAAEELQIIFKAMLYAKENQGDMSEYRRDVRKYDSLGVVPAQEVAGLIGEKLEEYLAGKRYWPIGYDKRSDGTKA